MKPKHTPGKWLAQYFTDSTTLIKAENHPKAIAEVRGTNIKANAALIASAPEMFSMLEQALRLIAVAENNNAYKDCALPLIGQRTTEQIESILKKARGE